MRPPEGEVARPRLKAWPGLVPVMAERPTQGERLEGLTVQEVVARYEGLGYEGQFGARLGGEVMCFTCREPSPAGRVALHRLGRVEGPTDPAAEVAVAAVECPRCKAKGTLVLAYGPSAPAEDGDVLAQLSDRRPRPAQG